ncbi:unnamed protein product [Bemisia tabaci]|uniref:Uncharacterized protein n=1 Tax=Bemisia tabaci TaxID=7038 RepID=A0A9P0A5T8_BEMTA|nr:unnamed protein product [Bemisia tabaci]
MEPKLRSQGFSLPPNPPLPAFQLPIMVPPTRPEREPQTPPKCVTPPLSDGQKVPSPRAQDCTFSDDEVDAENFLPFANEVEPTASFSTHTSSSAFKAKTERRFIYANEKEEQKLLSIIYEHYLQFRQDWPIEVRRTQDRVIVYIDNIEAFSYFGAPRLSKPIIECYKRDGDFAIIESGLKRHRVWSFLWFRLPLRHLPEASSSNLFLPRASPGNPLGPWTNTWDTVGTD